MTARSPLALVYLSSAQLTPERFVAAVRVHWSIENAFTGCSTAFGEDRARIRKDRGAESLAIIRKLALNALKCARPDISIRRKRKRSGWSDTFALSIIKCDSHG